MPENKSLQFRNCIPEELHDKRIWMGAGGGQPGDIGYKRPFNAKTGRPGSISNPEDWSTLDEVRAAGYRLVGFVLTKDDPYAVIDLDTYKAKSEKTRQLHDEILREVDTYTEISQSGQGTHIIGYGHVPGGGARNEANCLEMYSDGRFMICTGNIGVDGMIKPLADIQDLIDHFCCRIKKNRSSDVKSWRDLGAGEESILSDAELMERARNAANGDKFNALWNGDLSMHDGDHSRADAALIQFLAFYSPDNTQVAWLYGMSKLAERDKAQRPDYISRTIAYARAKLEQDKLPPLPNISAFIAKSNAMGGGVSDADVNTYSDHDPMGIPSKNCSNDDKTVTTPVADPCHVFPPGLMGKIAKCILESALYPVPAVALAGAIAIMAGIAGRQFNYSNSGLNLYVLLLAKTGTGKEAAARQIGTLIKEVRKTVPGASQFIGPAHFASGQALIKQFQAQQCFVSNFGEFADLMKVLTRRTVAAHDTALLRTIKDVFHKSGKDDVLNPMVYSDKEKNTAEVRSPALTIFAETVPESFFEFLDEALVNNGFLPRFLVLNYDGEKPKANDEHISSPPDSLIEEITNLCKIVIQAQMNGIFYDVTAEPAAHRVLIEFRDKADAQQRGASETIGNLWNRAGIKAMRLAALVAVGVNPLQPVISAEAATWAVKLVEQDVSVFVKRFGSGDIGDGDAKLHAIMVTVISKYMSSGNMDYKDFHANGCVPRRFLQSQVANRPAFKNHPLRAGAAINKILSYMVENGELIKLSESHAVNVFGTTGAVYRLGDQWGLPD